jgi:hypothetical protein
MQAPVFGLSTTPVADIKSALRQQIERDLLALIYRNPVPTRPGCLTIGGQAAA